MQKLACFSRRARKHSDDDRHSDARTSDPTSMAPHSLNLETFQLKFPFIKVHPRMNSMVEFKDRCAPEFLMQGETMGAFVGFLGGPALLRALSAFNTTGGERSTAPVHFTLFAAIHALSKALTEIRHRDDVEVEGHRDDVEVEGLHWEVKEDPCSSQEIEGIEEDTSDECLLSHEEAIFQAEAAYTTLSGGTGFGDIVAKAYDTAFMRKFSLQPEDISALVTLLVLELESDGKIREVLDAPHDATLGSQEWRYLESILRICLGESVLAWTKADVDKLVAEVRHLEQQESEDLLGGISETQLEAWRSSAKRRKLRRTVKGV